MKIKMLKFDEADAETVAMVGYDNNGEYYLVGSSTDLTSMQAWDLQGNINDQVIYGRYESGKTLIITPFKLRSLSSSLDI